MREVSYSDKKELEQLFVGRSVEKVSDHRLRLDDGTSLLIVPNQGGCSCSAGDYELTELNDFPNVITAVEAVREDPAHNDWETPTRYRLFVFADNQRINLLTVEGDDGSGYYGTGYWIEVEES